MQRDADDVSLLRLKRRGYLDSEFHGASEIPVWNDHTMTYQLHDFQWIAAIAHLGHDNSGHYQALLKVMPDNRDVDMPVGCLLTDDEAAPATLWSEPTWFQKQVTCLRLCSCEHLDLLQLPLPEGITPFQSRVHDLAHGSITPAAVLHMFGD